MIWTFFPQYWPLQIIHRSPRITQTGQEFWGLLCSFLASWWTIIQVAGENHDADVTSQLCNENSLPFICDESSRSLCFLFCCYRFASNRVKIIIKNNIFLSLNTEFSANICIITKPSMRRLSRNHGFKVCFRKSRIFRHVLIHNSIISRFINFVFLWSLNPTMGQTTFCIKRHGGKDYRDYMLIEWIILLLYRTSNYSRLNDIRSPLIFLIHIYGRSFKIQFSLCFNFLVIFGPEFCDIGSMTDSESYEKIQYELHKNLNECLKQ